MTNLEAYTTRNVTIVDIYCRVSTDPQEDNTSLNEQEATGRSSALSII